MKKLKRGVLKTLFITAVLMIICQANLFPWGSEEDVSMISGHVYIVENSLICLQNDLSDTDKYDNDFMKNMDYFVQYIEKFKKGAVAPDYSESNYTLFQDHFYDPYSGVNFSALKDGFVLTNLTYIHETAESRAREYTAEALRLWRKGYIEEAIYTFGKAFHYIGDMSVPQHAANAISATWEAWTFHHTFESYADSFWLNQAKSTLSTMGYKTDKDTYTESKNYSFFSDYLRAEIDRMAKEANNSYYELFDANLEPFQTWIIDKLESHPVYGPLVLAAAGKTAKLNEISLILSATSNNDSLYKDYLFTDEHNEVIKDIWDQAAVKNLLNGQRAAARIIYSFLNELRINNISVTDNSEMIRDRKSVV